MNTEECWYEIDEESGIVQFYGENGGKSTFDYIENPEKWIFPEYYRRQCVEEGDPYHTAFMVARDELIERGLIEG